MSLASRKPLPGQHGPSPRQCRNMHSCSCSWRTPCRNWRNTSLFVRMSECFGHSSLLIDCSLIVHFSSHSTERTRWLEALTHPRKETETEDEKIYERWGQWFWWESGHYCNYNSDSFLPRNNRLPPSSSCVWLRGAAAGWTKPHVRRCGQSISQNGWRWVLCLSVWMSIPLLSLCCCRMVRRRENARPAMGLVSLQLHHGNWKWTHQSSQSQGAASPSLSAPHWATNLCPTTQFY